MTSPIKVVSWNILASEWISKKDYPDINKEVLLNHKKRMKTITEKLKEYNADIIFLQEVMPEEYKKIQKEFKDEYYITQIQPIKWAYKNNNNTKGESGNVILIRIKMININNYKNIKIHKMDFCIILQYQHNETNKLITLCNIHLDDVSSVKRNTQMKKLLEFDSEINKSTTSTTSTTSNTLCIIGGDFNQQYKESSRLYSHPKFTVHNFCNTYFIDKKLNIDNILTRGFKMEKNSKCVHILNDNEDMFKKIGSDHIPVMTTILI